MKVAADLAQLDERRRLAPERLLAQLRWTPREAERAVHASSSSALGSGSSAST